MTTRQKAQELAAASALLVAVTSCTDPGNGPELTSMSAVTSTPSSPRTLPSFASEIASKGASEAVRRYYAIRNQLRQDSNQPLDLLETVAISTELSTQRNLFIRERKDGLRQTGETKVAVLEVQAVNLDNSDPSLGKVPTVRVDVCHDVSGVDITDAEGESVVTDARPDRGWQRYIVANYEYDSDPARGWKVASAQDIEREPCDAS